MKKTITMLLAPFRLATDLWPFTILFVFGGLVACIEQKNEYDKTKKAWMSCVTKPQTCSSFDDTPSTFWHEQFKKLPRGARI